MFTLVYRGSWHCKSVTIVWSTFMIINVLRRCDSVFIQWDAVKVSLCSFVFAKRPERPCISVELLYSHWCMKSSDIARVPPVLRTFRIINVLRRCDSVFIFNETLWKCHYAVLCLQSAPSVLALVLSCCIHIRVWRVLTLQECHYSFEDIYDN